MSAAADPERYVLPGNPVRDWLIYLKISLDNARALTDRLFAMVRPKALYKRPIAERHRLVFYVGHLEAFDWNLVRRARGADAESFHPEFDELFAFGIDPLDTLPSDKVTDWPSMPSIAAYRARAREAVDRRLRQDARDPTIYFIALEHRLMHAETLAYLLHRLPADDKVMMIHDTVIDNGAPQQSVVVIPDGEATLGRTPESSSFGWDNEYMAQTVRVPAFAMDKHDVTNQQFLEFVSSGGYKERSYWDDGAWDWIQKERIGAPSFWKQTAKGWMYQTMSETVPLPLSWPVYVSHAEATAYSRWCRRQLPTEAQYHRAAFGDRDGNMERWYPWGNMAPVAEFHGNFGSASWNPTPVGFHKAGFSAWGISDLMSNGWEWTSSVFAPFPGFTPLPDYPEYSSNFFDDRHYVLKGASPRTPTPLLRRSFRNWFQPHYPNIYATFRCVDN
jgi:ergothioneine biosynthesis protein EgtB